MPTAGIRYSFQKSLCTSVSWILASLHVLLVDTLPVVHRNDNFLRSNCGPAIRREILRNVPLLRKRKWKMYRSLFVCDNSDSNFNSSNFFRRSERMLQLVFRDRSISFILYRQRSRCTDLRLTYELEITAGKRKWAEARYWCRKIFWNSIRRGNDVVYSMFINKPHLVRVNCIRVHSIILLRDKYIWSRSSRDSLINGIILREYLKKCKHRL